MNKYTGLDSNFHKYASLVTDIMVVGFLWMLTSVAIITIGVATSASYYVLTKKITGRDGYLLKDFFYSFKQNFLKGILATILFIGIGLLVFINIYIIDDLEFLLILQYFIAFQAIIVCIYFFPLLARFDLSFINLLKTAFFLGNKHFFTTFINIFLLIALFILAMYIPILFIFISGIYLYLSSRFFVRIFRKHWADFDPIIEDDEIIEDDQ